MNSGKPSYASVAAGMAVTVPVVVNLVSPGESLFADKARRLVETETHKHLGYPAHWQATHSMRSLYLLLSI